MPCARSSSSWTITCPPSLPGSPWGCAAACTSAPASACSGCPHASLEMRRRSWKKSSPAAVGPFCGWGAWSRTRCSPLWPRGAESRRWRRCSAGPPSAWRACQARGCRSAFAAAAASPWARKLTRWNSSGACCRTRTSKTFPATARWARFGAEVSMPSRLTTSWRRSGCSTTSTARRWRWCRWRGLPSPVSPLATHRCCSHPRRPSATPTTTRPCAASSMLPSKAGARQSVTRRPRWRRCSHCRRMASTIGYGLQASPSAA
mmetsp:Transcript_19921/g.54822  ORF Transcript_19921/g.54822 Transcript_19921/m.54822 type:complete len:261 (-) Transcript_19921:1425-2207(-)